MKVEIDFLTGKTISNILINKTKDILILYISGASYNDEVKVVYMTFVGECCAKCFIANVSGITRKRFTIQSIEPIEWKDHPLSDPDNDIVIACAGVKIKTDRGYIDIDTRLEHNGYYGGKIILSTNCPIGQYDHAWDFISEEFELLENF